LSAFNILGPTAQEEACIEEGGNIHGDPMVISVLLQWHRQ
jgi:hypothetical protein